MAALAPESSSVLQEMLGPNFKNKKKNFACSMLECADACLLLCDELDISSNFHIAGLLAHCTTLQSVIMGDSGKPRNSVEVGLMVPCMLTFDRLRTLVGIPPVLGSRH